VRHGVLLVGLVAFAGGAWAGQAPVGAHVLFDFEAGAEGWHANVYGKGKMWAERAGDAAVGRGAMAVHLRELSGANLISPAVPFGQPWRQRRWDRIRFWANAAKPMTKARITFATNEATHNTYSLHFREDVGKPFTYGEKKGAQGVGKDSTYGRKEL